MPAAVPPAPSEISPALSADELREQLLEQVAEGGRLCRELETRLNQCPAPELEVLMKFYRVLVLKACGEAQAAPERLAFFSALMKAILEWARLEEKRKQRELAEQKYLDEVSARQTANSARSEPKVLTPETLKKIEHELHLF